MDEAADGLHNLIDGMLIGSSYLVGAKIGVATTLALSIDLKDVPMLSARGAARVHDNQGYSSG